MLQLMFSNNLLDCSSKTHRKYLEISKAAKMSIDQTLVSGLSLDPIVYRSTP